MSILVKRNIHVYKKSCIISLIIEDCIVITLAANNRDHFFVNNFVSPVVKSLPLA